MIQLCNYAKTVRANSARERSRAQPRAMASPWAGQPVRGDGLHRGLEEARRAAAAVAAAATLRVELLQAVLADMGHAAQLLSRAIAQRRTAEAELERAEAEEEQAAAEVAARHHPITQQLDDVLAKARVIRRDMVAAGVMDEDSDGDGGTNAGSARGSARGGARARSNKGRGGRRGGGTRAGTATRQQPAARRGSRGRMPDAARNRPASAQRTVPKVPQVRLPLSLVRLMKQHAERRAAGAAPTARRHGATAVSVDALCAKFVHRLEQRLSAGGGSHTHGGGGGGDGGAGAGGTRVADGGDTTPYPDTAAVLQCLPHATRALHSNCVEFDTFFHTHWGPTGGTGGAASATPDSATWEEARRRCEELLEVRSDGSDGGDDGKGRLLEALHLVFPFWYRSGMVRLLPPAPCDSHAAPLSWL